MNERGLPTTSPSARNLIAHPYFRPIVCLVGFLLLMQAIKSQWSSIRGGKHPAKEGSGKLREQLVVAHFMVSRRSEVFLGLAADVAAW